MTTLPPSRQLINGRTFSRSWSPSEMDPIQRPPARGVLTSEAVFVLTVIALGLIGLLVSCGG